MKWMLTFVVAMMFIAGYGVEVSEQLLDAIAIVESNCNDSAVGDNGNAVGRYQIWKTYVDDVNRIVHTSYSYADRKDPVKAREMVKIYLRHYGRVYERRTGKPATDEVLARIHNGGPRGYQKAATLKYWTKVRRELKK